MELWEILVNTACLTAVAGYILVLVYRAGRRVGSYEVSAEVSSRYQGLVNEIVRRGYAEVYPYNDPDDMPSELWEIEWKEGAAQDDAEASSEYEVEAVKVEVYKSGRIIGSYHTRKTIHTSGADKE